jgi:outer membrane protein W
MKKAIALSIIICSFSATGFTQKSLFAIGWEMNFPGNGDYVTKPSYAGAKLDYRYFINSNLSAGIAFNWATYEEYLPRQTFQKPDGNSAVTSDFVAQSYQLPIALNCHYYFGHEKTRLLKPYAGIALGAQYLEQTLYYNVYVTEENSWGFVARPELGVLITPSSFNGVAFHVAATYSYATNKTDLVDLGSFKNLGITIGMAFGR